MLPLLLQLPYPPSVNSYWRHVGPRVLVSAEGREYQRRVAAVVWESGVINPPLSCPLRLSLEVFPPDRRRRDLDNLLKAVQDSLVTAGVMLDDSQINEIAVRRRMYEPPHGFVLVEITECD